MTDILNGDKIGGVGADAQVNVVAEVARLNASIDGAAAAAELALAARPPGSADDALFVERQELCRQVAALRERVAQAEQRNEGPDALRAELATLLSFAATLQADADKWRSVFAQQLQALERRRTAARREQENRAAEHEKLQRSRDALQTKILQTAAGMAQQYRGECRRTIPVFTLGDGLTVCSVSVSCPRRGLRFARQWLVTLAGSHDVLIRRE